MRLNEISFSVISLIFIALFFILFFLVWQNRFETRVVTALLPALSAGIIIPLITIFTVLTPEKNITRIPTTFFYYSDLQRSVPLQEYYKSNTNLRHIDSVDVLPPLTYPSIYNQAEQAVLMSDFGKIPTISNPIEVDKGILSESNQNRYFRMFLTGIIWDMCKTYWKSWDIEMMETMFPSSISTETKYYEDSNGTFVSWENLLLELNKTDIFEDSPLQKDSIPGFSQGFYLPPESEIKFDHRKNFYLSINITNPFSSVSIEIQSASMSRGFGYIGTMLALPERDDIVNASYVIEIKSELKRWKIGHPNISKYRRWVSNIEEQFKQLNIEETQNELEKWRSFK